MKMQSLSFQSSVLDLISGGTDKSGNESKSDSNDRMADMVREWWNNDFAQDIWNNDYHD